MFIVSKRLIFPGIRFRVMSIDIYTNIALYQYISLQISMAILLINSEKIDTGRLSALSLNILILYFKTSLFTKDTFEFPT
jgi:hypothetical protein